MPVFSGRDLSFAELVGRQSADPLAAYGATDCSVRVVEIPHGPRTPHRHPHSCEVIYVAEGTGRVWEDDVCSPVVPGDVVVIEAGVAHATVCTASPRMRLVCFFPHPDLARNSEELPGPVRT